MSGNMKAARVHNYGEKLRLEEIPRPEPKDNQILIAILASGVCHTDLHAVAGDMPGNPSLPFIPGHEIIGAVAAMGKNATRFKEGDLVGLPSLYWACGDCEYCKSGWETLCHKQLATGYTVDGGFAEYVVAQEEFVAKIPAGVDIYKLAPVLCAGVTTYKGLKQTEAREGDWVVISGIGGLGHVAVQYARALGFRVAAADVDDKKLQLAKKLGAEFILNANDQDVVSTVQNEIGGAHAVLVTAASSSAFQAGVKMLRRGGKCVLNGLPPGNFPLSICDFVLAGQTLHGSIIGTRRDLDEAIDMAVAVNLETTIERHPLENINEIFKRLSQGDIVGRAVLEFSH